MGHMDMDTMIRICICKYLILTRQVLVLSGNFGVLPVGGCAVTPYTIV